MTPIVKQVLLDLDNDGWTNEGVPIGTPSNVFPRSPYTTGTQLQGRQYTTSDDVYEDVQDVSKQGLMKRKVKMGKDVDGDYAENIHMSFDEYYSEYQRRLYDPENLIPNAVDNDLGSVYLPPNFVYINFHQTGYGKTSKAVSGVSPFRIRYQLGLDYNSGSVHGQYGSTGFIDGSSEYSYAPVWRVAQAATTHSPVSVDSALGDSGGIEWKVAQSFLASAGSPTEISFELAANFGSPTGDILVELRTNGSSEPSTTVLWSTTVTPTPSAVHTIPVTGITITAGTYWVVLTSVVNQTLNNRFIVKSNRSNQYTDGKGMQYRSDTLTWVGDANLDYGIGLSVKSTSATWSGFQVTAGNTYTFSMKVKAATVSNASVRLYGDSANSASPYYNRVYLAGSDISATTSYGTQVNYTFTVPVGVTQFAVDVQNTSGTNNYLGLGDFMLFDGVVTPPTDRMYDEQTAYGESQFAIAVEANKDYTLSFWVKSDDGIDLLDGYLASANIGGTDTAIEDTHSIAITNEWVRHNFYIPSRAYTRGIGFEWTTEKGGNPTGLDNVGTIEFKGFMLVEGDTPTPYQVGPLAAYDDITSYVLSMDTNSGKDDFLDSMAYEGQANILLNNVSRIFSPQNQDSPLYGYLIQNIKVVIRAGGASIWQGWVTEYEITPGLYEERQVTLKCKQGIYRLKEGEFTATVRTDAKIDTVVREIIENSGWKPTDNPFFSVLGFNYTLDENFNLNDVDSMFSYMDEGINTLEITGLDWGRQTDVDTALQDLLESESAMLWIDRDGKLVLVNRDYWVNRTPDKTYNIDNVNAMTRAEYRYGQDMVNRVQVTINRKRQTTDEPVWKTYRAVYVKPASNRYLEVNPRYQEGRSRTVVEFTLEGSTKTGYYSDPGMKYEDTDNADSTDMDKVILELFPDVGNRYRLRINNTGTKGLWIDVELKGSFLETGDETPITFEDTDAIETTGAVHYEQIETNLLSRDYEAESMAAFRILRAANPEGEFRALEFTVVSAEALAPLLETKLGHIIAITESQTGEVSNPHAVIAEEFSFNGGYATVTFILARAQKDRYFALDDTPLYNPTVNLVEDMTNIVAMDELAITGVMEWPYEGLETILYWNLRGRTVGDLLLNPAPNQYIKFNQDYGVGYWPELTAASASTAASIQQYGNYSDSGGLADTITDEETGTLTYIPYNSTVSETASIGVDWRVIVGGQMTGITKQGDTTLKMLGRIPVSNNTLYTAYARNFHSISGFANGATNYGLRAHKQYDLLASGLATGTQLITGYHDTYKVEFDSGDANAIMLSMFGISAAAYSQVGKFALLQRSNIKNSTVSLDTTVTHKYTLYCKINPKQRKRNMTLRVYSGVDGSLIGSHAQLVGYTLAKFEVSIPTGANSSTVYGILSVDPDFLTSDYAMYNIYIYAYGITQASVSSYTELLTPTQQLTLYL
jgi:hypothetical protein